MPPVHRAALKYLLDFGIEALKHAQNNDLSLDKLGMPVCVFVPLCVYVCLCAPLALPPFCLLGGVHGDALQDLLKTR